MAARIAIDTGGTFTDLVLLDPDGKLHFHKVSSTPQDPGRALIDGVCELLERAGCRRDDLELLIHGTTVATNTILQRNGARVALLTTEGFRDVLHIQRQDRPQMYDLRVRRPVPLVPRQLRLEVRERLGPQGEVDLAVDRKLLLQSLDRLRRHKVEAVAVGLLHSHANPAHEQEVGEIVARELPDASVCLSHELVRERGEYERFSTCVMNAYVQPVMSRYLERIDAGLKQAEISAPLFVMKSNGGTMSAAAAARQAVFTVLSGPAGGAVASRSISESCAGANLIAADMGGTSFDVTVIHGGSVHFARDAEMGGLALKVPMLDIHTVGAGGGSIGWIDAGGSLRVGPQSAGADPGPACYGKGGGRPTVTDANLLLGRLATRTLLGGGLELDLEAARRAMHDHLAAPLGLNLEAAAEGLIRVVNATMTAAIRKLTVERGHDPRDFALCAYGGAGPLHGAELAAEMGVVETLIPVAPGVTSAVGLLQSELREDNVRTEVGPLDSFSSEQLTEKIEELAGIASARLAAARGGGANTQCRFGLRYLGQGYELPVEVSRTPLDLTNVAADFHTAHERAFGFKRPDQTVELVNIWVSMETDTGTVQLPEWPSAADPQPVGRREVVFRGDSYTTPVFKRDVIGGGTDLEGPAVIEQLDSTTIVWPGQQAEMDTLGQLRLGPMPAGFC
jgi:N-methylhydantoinase A